MGVPIPEAPPESDIQIFATIYALLKPLTQTKRQKVTDTVIKFIENMDEKDKK